MSSVVGRDMGKIGSKMDGHQRAPEYRKSVTLPRSVTRCVYHMAGGGIVLPHLSFVNKVDFKCSEQRPERPKKGIDRTRCA